MKNKNALTSLRFIAAYLVVGFHFFSFKGETTFIGSLFKHGYLGVDFFFILSGFVLGLRYRSEILLDKFNKFTFILYRLARIAPTYYLSLLLASPVLYKGFVTSEFLSSFEKRLILIFTNMTFTQSFFPVSALLENWNVPSWSLSVEFFYYILFPFISIKIIKSTKVNLWLTSLFIIMTVLYLVNMTLPDHVNFMGTYTLVTWINNPLLRLPQFLWGHLIAQKYLNGFGKEFSSIGFKIGVIASILLLTLPLPDSLINHGSPFSIFIFSILIYFTALKDNGSGFLNWKPLVFLGEASYALYILQVPTKILFQQIYSKILNLGDTFGLLYCFYISVTLITTSCIVYKYFELPINKFLRKKIDQRANA